LYDDVLLNEYGFYTLKKLPSDEEREAYYRDKYYQNDSERYTVHYSDQELKFFNAKLEQKLLLINEHSPSEKHSFLDVGCGEGFAVAFFKEKGFAVLGLDYSSAGIKNHNIDVMDDVLIGDLYDSINNLIAEGKLFDVVNMDNILEHVKNPKRLLEQIYKLTSMNGIVIIKVPNDFSVLHKYFIENRVITKPHWVVALDHISYFNKEGLINICDATGFNNVDILGNYLTEFYILNPNTNYLENPSVGKSCHLARVAQENILHSISPKKTIELYRVIGEMGLGREIIGVFRRK